MRIGLFPEISGSSVKNHRSKSTMFTRNQRGNFNIPTKNLYNSKNNFFPENFDSIRQIEIAVDTRLNNLISTIDPFLFEIENPTKLIIEQINFNRDSTILSFLKQKVMEIEQENIDLSFKIMSNKELEYLCIELFDAENRLLQYKMMSHPPITQKGPIDNVKLSKLKSEIDRNITENTILQQQIDAIDKRIDLMQRRKSYIPNPYQQNEPTPRRKRHRPMIINKKGQISQHASFVSNIII